MSGSRHRLGHSGPAAPSRAATGPDHTTSRKVMMAMSDPATPPERWLPVPGYEGLYEVSDLGRVRSIAHSTRAGMRGGQMLKPQFNSRGYHHVGLRRDGKKAALRLNRLVLAAFAGPCPPGEVARHGPGGKLDNRLTNLSYGTQRENIHDKIRDGTAQAGERNTAAKLTGPDVIEIRRQGAGGGSQEIGRASWRGRGESSGGAASLK